MLAAYFALSNGKKNMTQRQNVLDSQIAYFLLIVDGTIANWTLGNYFVILVGVSVMLLFLAISYYAGNRKSEGGKQVQVDPMTEEHDHPHYHGVDKAEENVSVGEAVRILLESITPVKPETISFLKANNRILFDDLISPVDLPRRARVNARRLRCEHNARRRSGAEFQDNRRGEDWQNYQAQDKNGEAVRIATGSFVPIGANAVVMIEYAQVQEKTLRVNRAIRIHDNILSPGEDLSNGELLLPRGTRVRPQHVALFSMLGIRKVKVFSKPKIAFFSTGDELIDTVKGNSKGNTGINDATRPFMAVMISDLGGVPIDLGIARDSFVQIRSKMLKGLKYDALILSAGLLSAIGITRQLTRRRSEE